MRKRNKLYTANRWNQPLFAQGVDRENYNIFDGMFQSSLNTSPTLNGLSGVNSGLSYQTPQLSKPTVSQPIDWSNNVQANKAVLDSQNMVNGFNAEASSNNPFKQFAGSSGSIGNDKAAAGKALMSTGLEVTGLIGKSDNFKRGLWDRADPVHYLAGGRESAVGNALGDAGVSVFKSGAQSGNGYMMLAGAGLKVVGGLTNALWGMKTDTKRLNAINTGIDTLSNFKSNATSFDDISGPSAIVNNTKKVYQGGLFSSGKAKRKNRELADKVRNAEAWANNSVNNNINNIADTQMNNLLANYSAFGGPLGGSMSGGAIDYGFMTDYLTMKNKAAEAKNRTPSNVFGSLAMTPASTFALGGDMQTNGADFTDGLAHIDAGLSHEENPYQGVQVGISRDNGQPNLVEEGETIFDDYVFSKRIKADKQTKAKFHVGKNTNISFADLSKKLEKESLERPNDPISQAGLKKQMHDLADEQERQKSERQQKEAEDAFSMLPPEQQQAIMQQVVMEEQQAAQQQQAQENGQSMQEQEGNPQQEPQQQVDAQMQQQQQMNPQMMGDNGEQINACGGKMNRFDDGGKMNGEDLKKKIYGLLDKVYTDSDFDKWAKEHKVDKITDWEHVLQNKQFMDALSAYNPALGDVLSKGYDFGNYKAPSSNGFTADFKHGGWGLEGYSDWDGSTDAAWQEAVKKGLVKPGMNSEEIGKALSQTDAYKRGTEWLKANENNRLSYLQKVFNSEDAPQAARDYAARFVDKNGWLKDAKRDYQTIFEDPNGTGVRNTHPGTYWKTPDEVSRNRQIVNRVVNDNGTIEDIIGNVPKDWTSAGNYNWADANSDYTYNYYRRPTSNATPDGKKEEDTELVPVHKSSWPRYAGLFGPVVGLGMQMAGVGKPDYSKLDAAVDAASGAPALADYKPIGNYIGYRPMDIWYEQNRLNANSRATDRAILNNSSPLGTKTAGLLANGYNNQIASGNLYRQALEYNDAQRQKVADFNRGTDMFNANAYNQTSATNAQLQNNHRNFKAQMMMDAARQRMAADAAWNQGIYGNVQGLFKGLSDLGRENEQHNMIADMIADGIFGTMSDKQHIGNDYLVKRVPKKKACGGRISRRKGLTF